MNSQYDDCALALMTTLDLVITAPNSVGELAGALGRPTWRVHRTCGTWTMLGTDRRPWFPSMTIFEATKTGGASELMVRVATALSGVLASGG